MGNISYTTSSNFSETTTIQDIQNAITTAIENLQKQSFLRGVDGKSIQSTIMTLDQILDYVSLGSNTKQQYLIDLLFGDNEIGQWYPSEYSSANAVVNSFLEQKFVVYYTGELTDLTLATTQSLVIIDPRLEYINEYEGTGNFDDISCVLSLNCAGESPIFEVIQNFPRLYFDSDTRSFCWEINGKKTKINAQGKNGSDGTSQSLTKATAVCFNASNNKPFVPIKTDDNIEPGYFIFSYNNANNETQYYVPKGVDGDADKDAKDEQNNNFLSSYNKTLIYIIEFIALNENYLSDFNQSGTGDNIAYIEYKDSNIYITYNGVEKLYSELDSLITSKLVFATLKTTEASGEDPIEYLTFNSKDAIDLSQFISSAQNSENIFNNFSKVINITTSTSDSNGTVASAGVIYLNSEDKVDNDNVPVSKYVVAPIVDTNSNDNKINTGLHLYHSAAKNGIYSVNANLSPNAFTGQLNQTNATLYIDNFDINFPSQIGGTPITHKISGKIDTVNLLEIAGNVIENGKITLNSNLIHQLNNANFVNLTGTLIYADNATVENELLIGDTNKNESNTVIKTALARFYNNVNINKSGINISNAAYVNVNLNNTQRSELTYSGLWLYNSSNIQTAYISGNGTVNASLIQVNGTQYSVTSTRAFRIAAKIQNSKLTNNTYVNSTGIDTWEISRSVDSNINHIGSGICGTSNNVNIYSHNSSGNTVNIFNLSTDTTTPIAAVDSDGNFLQRVTTKTNSGTTVVELKKLFDIIYPLGSTFLTFVKGEFPKIGEWELVSEGKYLRGASASLVNNTTDVTNKTGGSNSIKAENLPAHSHTYEDTILMENWSAANNLISNYTKTTIGKYDTGTKTLGTFNNITLYARNIHSGYGNKNTSGNSFIGSNDGIDTDNNVKFYFKSQTDSIGQGSSFEPEYQCVWVYKRKS